MALINCPECNKEISEKANTCPSCGFPIGNIDNQLSTTNVQEITCPTFPSDLSIGGQIVNWGGDAAFTGDFRAEDNIVRVISPGGIKVLLHKSGINITNSLYISQLEIHNTQLISVTFADQSELLRQNKSVIGRAIVGNILMGPMGAIIGGMSGIGTKSAKNNSYLVINYWDKFTKQAQTLLIRGKDEEIRTFVGRWNTERSKSPTEHQIKALENLNETDRQILKIYQEQGVVAASKFYWETNKIDLKNPDIIKISRTYVESLAKTYGIQGKSEGCFIATACYGNYNAHEVLILREFRDAKLLTNPFGKMFVSVYYTISPFIASKISKSNNSKDLIRRYFLQPIVYYLKR